MDWGRFLNDTLARYDRWQEEGRLTHSAKVIPVSRSLAAKQWVMPTEQVMHHLRNSRSFALAHCRCRTLAGHCDRPREVCFTTNDFADAWVDQGIARRVSLDEARRRLHEAAESGLVHMTLFNPRQHVFAVCSCCPCCCHDLQFLLKHGRNDLIARSQYIARTDAEACLHCGACVERCIFGARALQGDRLVFDPQACYGCGLCVTACPAGAVALELEQPG